MKELKKFHLRPEQELSDEEMKQIKAGTEPGEYAECGSFGQNECLSIDTCIKMIPIGGKPGYYYVKTGHCYFGKENDYSGTSCFCQI